MELAEAMLRSAAPSGGLQLTVRLGASTERVVNSTGGPLSFPNGATDAAVRCAGLITQRSCAELTQTCAR